MGFKLMVTRNAGLGCHLDCHGSPETLRMPDRGGHRAGLGLAKNQQPLSLIWRTGDPGPLAQGPGPVALHAQTPPRGRPRAAAA